MAAINGETRRSVNNIKKIPDDILNCQCSIIFVHPVALLSEGGSKLMPNQVKQSTNSTVTYKFFLVKCS